MDLNDEVLEIDEAAKFIRMSPGWLRKSDCPRSKLGKCIRFTKSQLLAYVKAHQLGKDPE